jgi:DNA polymerase family A
MIELRDFKEIWSHDFEYRGLPGEHVDVHCLVAHELRTGRHLRLWRDQLRSPPYRMDSDCLFVSYNAAAELSAHLSLGWPLPVRILDLFQEFKCLTNGRVLPDGRSLLGAMSFFGLDAISVVEKKEMQDLALRGAPFTPQEKKDLIDYCETDVVALAKLFWRMLEKINLPQALHRGRFMRALSVVEFNGTPIDAETLTILRQNWESIKLDLIADVDKSYGVYEGTSFRLELFAHWLRSQGIRDWPTTDVGRLSKSDETFKSMAGVYPQLQPLRELKYTIDKMRLEKLAVGLDHRNRVSLWAFSTKTSRNAPKASEYIFGPSVWLRFLIQPAKGWAAEYIDYSAQEFAIASALANDPQMIQSYKSGDPYTDFGKAIHLLPLSANKDSHGKERDKLKQCLLGILYGMKAKGLSIYAGVTEADAESILKSHKHLYKRFWEWTDGVLEQALLKGKIHTCYGWQFSAPWKPAKLDERNKKKRNGVPVRTIKNFLVQATAAEMLRLATCLMVERGIRVCALIHDAVLIEAPATQIERDSITAKNAMAEASRIILQDRLELRTDGKPFSYPDRYFDKRGVHMWNTVMRILQTSHQQQEIVTKPDQLGLDLWL